MFYVIETATGAILMPYTKHQDKKATVSSWAAKCAMDADLRTTSRAHRELASKLHISMEGEL